MEALAVYLLLSEFATSGSEANMEKMSLDVCIASDFRFILAGVT